VVSLVRRAPAAKRAAGAPNEAGFDHELALHTYLSVSDVFAEVLSSQRLSGAPHHEARRLILTNVRHTFAPPR
jgi:hypothetical protein